MPAPLTAVAADDPMAAQLVDLRWPHGFLIGATADAGRAAHYRHVPFAVPLHVHPRTRHAALVEPGRIVALIGEVAHPDHPGLDTAGLVALLGSRFAERQAEIDRMIGRFVVVSGTSAHDLRLQTDAIAMRAVFFAAGRNGLVAGSHARMVALAATGAAVHRGGRFALGWPGIGTPFAGVLRVPPNVELDLSTGKLVRFFPRVPIPRVDLETAWAVAFDRARAAVAAFARRKPLLMSLTGGLDSRTTLAAVRDSWPRLDFFTYLRDDPSVVIDSRVAAAIASILGLRHRIVEVAEKPDPMLLAAIKGNTFSSHGHKLACSYHRAFGVGKTLHIRTNLLELARSNLFAANDRVGALRGGPDTPERMTLFYDRAGRMPAPQPHVLPEFKEYVDRTDYRSTLGMASPWDLYFVEHRMGAWHAGIVLESDIAFDTVIAFNSREVVRHIMGVPQTERAAGKQLQERLTKLLPELASIPINPKQFP